MILNNIVKVLIVDDHVVVRLGIASILKENKDILIIGEAQNGTDALALIETKNPDLIIVDISMPDMNGLELLQKIKKDYPQIKVLIFTMHDESEYLVSAIELGVDGYLLKSSDLDDMENAIVAIYSGQHYYSEQVSVLMASAIKNKKNNDTNPLETPLTDREMQVLKHIVNGLSNKLIAEVLYISSKTVAIHRTNIMRKMNAKNTADVVRIAIENKIIFNG